MNKRPRKSKFINSLWFFILILIFPVSGGQADVTLQNFEGLIAPYEPGWGGTLVINSVGTSIVGPAPGSTTCLRINYTVSGPQDNNYEYKARRMDFAIKDLRNCKELRFWLKGDGSTKNRLFFYLGEANGVIPPYDNELFKNAQYGGNATSFDLSSTEWRLFRIPLTQNSKTTDAAMWFAGAFGPDSFNSSDRRFSAYLSSLVLMLSGDQPTTGDIYIDDIIGVWDANPTIVEDFEYNNAGQFNSLVEYALFMRNEVGERNVNAARDGWNFNSGSTASLSADSVTKHDGNQSLKIAYQLVANNDKYIMLAKLLGGKEWDAAKNYRRCQDWSGYGGLRFWYKGDGSYGPVGPYENSTSPLNLLRVRTDAKGAYTTDADWWATWDAANKYPFEADVPLEISAEWRQRYIPFSMMGVWADITDPFTPPTAADLSAVKLLTFAIRDAAGGKVTDTDASSIYLDQIELYAKTAADVGKVYEGVKAETAPSGLLYTFDGRIESHTYDNALAAMVFILRGDQARAKSVLDYYKNNIYTPDVNGTDGSGPGFDGFYYAYNAGTGLKMKADESGNLGRGAGPCAFMLMALLYYESVYGVQPAYATMIDDIAGWIKGLQVIVPGPDFGKIKWGYDYAGGARTMGSVEVNADCYAALARYAIKTGSVIFKTAALDIKTWLNTMWVGADNRFKVGDTAPVNDKALDVYSIPVLALMGIDAIIDPLNGPIYGRQGTDPMYSNCLTAAELTPNFVVTKYSMYTGQNVTGFDFGGPTGSSPDGDGIWFEGTSQMAEAFHVIGNDLKKDSYVAQVENGISDMCGPGAQALSYATPFKPSTGYGPTGFDGSPTGWPMSVTDAHLGSMCWYIFAKSTFNPLWPITGGTSLTDQAMEHRETNQGPWNPLADGGAIYNDEEVKAWVSINNVGAPAIRFYYANDGNDPLTYKDQSGDVGTSYYLNGVFDSIVGPKAKYYAILDEYHHSCNNTVKWKPCGSSDNGTTWPYNGNIMTYTVTAGGALLGDRDQKVLVGDGNNTMPNNRQYPLVWNSAGGYFETNEETDYSPVAHFSIPSLSIPTTQLLSIMNPATYYYFMPAGNNATDSIGLNNTHLVQNGADGYGDIFYGESPFLYVRAAYGDILDTNSLIAFGYGPPALSGDPTPHPGGGLGNMEYFNRDPIGGPWVWTEKVYPNSGAYTEAQKHLNGVKLHYDFLRPTAAALTDVAGLPEGATSYYSFKVKDEIDGGQVWQKQLFKDGLYNDGANNREWFSYSMLQDDRTRPYIRWQALDSSALRPRSITDPGNCSWINFYVVKADIYDSTDGASSAVPATYGNVINSRGTNSGIYSGDPAAVGAAGSPVHDTRIYYKITSAAPNTLDGYQIADKYLIGNSVNGYYYIPDNAVENATYDRNDANGDGLGYVQMTGPAGGGEWTGSIPLREGYIGQYVYYRIFVCNNDNDPQGYRAPSANFIPAGFNPPPTVGNDDYPVTYNNHGAIAVNGTSWADPYDLTAGGACDSDRDHGWAMLTRYGGTVIGPKMIKIRARVNMGGSLQSDGTFNGGVTRDIIAYVNAEGGVVGNVLYTEIQGQQQ